MKNIEICAPVGSLESFAAAVRAGADSIYFGVGELNMRARAASNFRLEELPALASKSKRHGIKLYLTLNTLVYNSELEDIRELCLAAKKYGIDAIVASDISVIQFANSIGLSTHISVQANVSNIDAVKFYAKFADVIVLARELKLSQICEIIQTIEKEGIVGPSGEFVRIEIFAHGALCVAISGKCYMSLASYNASANRGGCYQNCRRAYRVIDEQTGDELVLENKYVMSPKDICTLPFLDEIIKSGISILKIEGRGRSSDYVYTVVKAYREAVDLFSMGEFPQDKLEVLMESLTEVFNRGFWEGGYYLGENLKEWSGHEGNQALFEKKHIGEVTNYFHKIGVAEILLNAGSLELGDKILVCGKTTGSARTKVDEMRFDHKSVKTGQKGQIISLPIKQKVRRNDKVYLLTKRRFGY